MSERTGTTIRCDRYECKQDVFDESPEVARERAAAIGWTKSADGRDFCVGCSSIRAKRTKISDIAPAGVRLFTAFEAAEAAGFERRDYDEATGVAHFYCCGQEIEVSSLLGDAYAGTCKICKAAIADLLGPSIGNHTVGFPDPDRVDVEDPRSWVVVADLPAIEGAPAR
jgi:hypothetical protein